MNLEELKKLIQDVKTSLPCKGCGKRYEDHCLRLVGAAFYEAFLIGHCGSCGNDVMIHATLGYKNTPHRSIKSKKINLEISENDILDMRNFLKEFDGDFIRLFESKS